MIPLSCAFRKTTNFFDFFSFFLQLGLDRAREIIYIYIKVRLSIKHKISELVRKLGREQMVVGSNLGRNRANGCTGEMERR